MQIRGSEVISCYFIAEIGHNHQGNLDQALEMIEAAADSGAHAVKLQKRDNRAIFTDKLFNAAYEGPASFGTTYGEHREALEFGYDEYLTLRAQAHGLGIDFMATAFDPVSADFLAEIGIDAIKIASADLTNSSLLQYVAQLELPMILSTGGATMDDVRRAYTTVCHLVPDVALLQCTATYPACADDLDLRVISSYRDEFPDIVVGFSGHDLGFDGAAIAYALGARMIEKHFTLDRNAKGSDHHFSMEPADFAAMIERVSQVERMLGSPKKTLRDNERPALSKMAKQLVALRDIGVGDLVSTADVGVRSAGAGMPPYRFDALVGRRLAVPVRQDEPFPDLNLDGAYHE